MDQLKEVLKQAIKYRFWIAVCLSAVLPMLAYILGAGPIQQKAVAGAAAIDSAYKGVKTYTQGKPINKQYSEIVTTKTDELNKEVDESWKQLYARQAPLLTWPEQVQERFTAWGREWPKDTDASAVQIAIINYVDAYPKFVTQVYKSFQPFDPESGTGVVSAPPESTLLRPATFSESSPPSLGKVWAAQERLWIQRTLLDVVAKVNKDAKGWDTAIIKQINDMEIGNTQAQDQRSIAKGEELEEAPDITDPALPPPAEEDTSSSTSMPSGYGGAATAANTESVFYIKSESPAIKILPVQMTVLIEQDHIQDFLVALENSPMTIQVMDFEMYKPLARVTKPEKGTQMAFGMGMGMGMGAPNEMMMRGAMTGYGARMMAGSDMSQNMNQMYMAMNGGAAGKTKGVDARSKTREKDAEALLKSAMSGKAVSVHNPYFNIVEVKIYGQARFFNPPPPAPAAEPSQSEAPAEAAADAEKKAEPAKAEPDAEKKAEPAKADAEKKAEPAKAEPDAEKKAEPAKAEPDAEKKAEPAKADAEKKAEPAKADAEKKAEPAKVEGGATPPQ